jgi:hypothetical protein
MDKKCRLDAATEKAWAKAGKAPMIWRIEKFKVVMSQTWPVLYPTASALNTYKAKHPLQRNRQNCLGSAFLAWQDHLQDEAGTAAYKTVELDFLGGAPVQQSSEVQGRGSLPSLLARISTQSVELTL